VCKAEKNNLKVIESTLQLQTVQQRRDMKGNDTDDRLYALTRDEM